MKNKKVEISRINIRIGDKEISLTLEEAQELRQILDNTFGQKTVFFNPLPPPVVVYPSPFIIERPVRPYRYWDYTTTCGSVSSGNVATFTLTSGGTDVSLNMGDFDALPVT